MMKLLNNKIKKNENDFLSICLQKCMSRLNLELWKKNKLYTSIINLKYIKKLFLKNPN